MSILGRDRVDEAGMLLPYCSTRVALHRKKKDSSDFQRACTLSKLGEVFGYDELPAATGVEIIATMDTGSNFRRGRYGRGNIAWG